jgi:hypothetical protein
MQFPVRDPSAGRFRRASAVRFLARSFAIDTAAGAQRMAVAALVAALMALVATIGLGTKGAEGSLELRRGSIAVFVLITALGGRTVRS